MKKVVYLFIVLFFLSSCASGVAPSSLIKSKRSQIIVLNEEVSYIVKRTIGVDSKLSLAKGVYNPTFESKKGVFYVGPKNCVVIEEMKEPIKLNGGIFISHDKSKFALFNFIKDHSEIAERAGWLIGALIKRDTGRIVTHSYIDDEEFKETIIESTKI